MKDVVLAIAVHALETALALKEGDAQNGAVFVAVFFVIAAVIYGAFGKSSDR